ncbi:MAG: YggT family protein [Blastocatellia bacterium]|nr:YggT family protein [Blastocatellia bacterium]
MTDDKLEIDEAQRAANYEAVKTSVQSDVGGEIAARADRGAPTQAREIEDVASGMRQRAVDDVVDTEREVERGRFTARISQVVDYIFMLVYSILAIRLLLELFAARESAGFVQFIKSVTDPFYAPFRGIVASPTTAEGFTLALPIIVAIVCYMILHLAINGLLRLFAHRKTHV